MLKTKYNYVVDYDRTLNNIPSNWKKSITDPLQATGGNLALNSVMYEMIKPQKAQNSFKKSLILPTNIYNKWQQSIKVDISWDEIFLEYTRCTKDIKL